MVNNYDVDGTKVLEFELLNEGGDGDGRDLAASGQTVTVEFVLKLIDSVCTRPALDPFEQRARYCTASDGIVALLDLAVNDVYAFLRSLGIGDRSTERLLRAAGKSGIVYIKF